MTLQDVILYILAMWTLLFYIFGIQEVRTDSLECQLYPTGCCVPQGGFPPSFDTEGRDGRLMFYRLTQTGCSSHLLLNILLFVLT
jgi:hypothetical protein